MIVSVWRPCCEATEKVAVIWVTITSRVGKAEIIVECCSYARRMDVIGRWRGRCSCKGVASRRRSQGIIGESPMSAWQTASGRAMAVSVSWRFVVIADCEVAVGG